MAAAGRQDDRAMCCEACAKPWIPRRQKTRKLPRDEDDLLPAKCFDHCTGDHLIRRDTATDDDDGIPVDAGALAMLDKAMWVDCGLSHSLEFIASHDRSNAAFCWCQRQDQEVMLRHRT